MSMTNKFEEIIINDNKENLPQESGNYIFFAKVGGIGRSFFKKDRPATNESWMKNVYSWYKPISLQETGEHEINILNNRVRLLKKALVRMIAEFDTTTPVIPNQRLAVRFANNLIYEKNISDTKDDTCLHPYNKLVMSDKFNENGGLLECKVCGKLV